MKGREKRKKRGSSVEVEVEVEEGFLADITFGSNFDSREGKGPLGLTGRGSSWDDTSTGINTLPYYSLPNVTYLTQGTLQNLTPVGNNTR